MTKPYIETMILFAVKWLILLAWPLWFVYFIGSIGHNYYFGLLNKGYIINKYMYWPGATLVIITPGAVIGIGLLLERLNVPYRPAVQFIISVFAGGICAFAGTMLISLSLQGL
jgi:hypothetical protein